MLKGRGVGNDRMSGIALVSDASIAFLGGVDCDTGVIVEHGHPLEGVDTTGKILVFPSGKGSTVGSYALYRLNQAEKGPVGLVCRSAGTVVIAGAVLSEIPLVDGVDTSKIKSGTMITIDANVGEVVFEE